MTRLQRQTGSRRPGVSFCGAHVTQSRWSVRSWPVRRWRVAGIISCRRRRSWVKEALTLASPSTVVDVAGEPAMRWRDEVWGAAVANSTRTRSVCEGKRNKLLGFSYLRKEEVGLAAWSILTHTPPFCVVWICLCLLSTPLCLLHAFHFILFLTPTSHFKHPSYLLCAPPYFDNSAPLCVVCLVCFIIMLCLPGYLLALHLLCYVVSIYVYSLPLLFMLCTPYVIGPHLLTAPHFSQFIPLLLGSFYFQLLLVALPSLITTPHLLHAPHTLLMYPPVFFHFYHFFIKLDHYNFLKKNRK